jgi:predicted phage terminase large subunit-like protein
MSALQYVEEPNYSALMLRRTYGELALPGALMDMAAEWLQPFRKTKEVHWSEKNKTYTFPSGATLTFGFLEHPNDKYRYQGAQFQGIFFDEVTQFEEEDYKYLFSRSRRTLKMAENVPLRFRSACIDTGDVLTINGWKPIKDVNVGELVYSVDRFGSMELKPVIAKQEYNYDGELIRVKKKNLYMSFTPNHRLFNKRGARPGKPKKYDLQPYNEIKKATIDIVRAPIKYKSNGKITPELGLDETTFISLLGLYLAEGSYKTTVRKGNYNIMITQCQKNKMDIIQKEILSKININYCLCKNGDACFCNKKWWSYFSQFGKAKDKFVPRDILTNASKEQLQLLFKWMVFGDGHMGVNGNINYTTVSYQLAKDVAEIAVKLGCKVMITKTVLPNVNHNDRYSVYIKPGQDTTRLEYNGKDRNDYKKEKYIGRVYCISVKDNETFVVKQNNYVWVSGNSNPGGIGHQWCKKRFLIEGRTKGRIFIPAVLSDNKYLDYDSYVENLNELSPLEREQLLNGDWEINSGGKVFKREWFEIIDKLPETDKHITRVRYWDLAASEENKTKGYGYDPAFTVGLKMAKIVNKGQQDIYVIEDIKRFQKLPDGVETEILATAYEDGKEVEIWMEQEPAGSGKTVINDYVKLLSSFTFRGQKEGGSKVLRASKVSATAGNGRIKLLRGHWNEPFLDEVEYFPDSKYKDQVDCLSGSFDKLRFFSGYAVLPQAIAHEQGGSYWLTE